MFRIKPILTDRAKALRRNQTDAEKLLRASLHTLSYDGIKFRRQQPIDNYIVDFVHLDKKLVIELDGGQHNEPQPIEYDNSRTSFLEQRGFRVVRFRDNDVLQNIDGVMEKKTNILAELSPSPVPLPSRERRIKASLPARAGSPLQEEEAD
jgi:very-short-patch-repair endonuclease